MDGLCRVEGGLWVGWACASYWTDLWVEGLLWEDSIEPMPTPSSIMNALPARRDYRLSAVSQSTRPWVCMERAFAQGLGSSSTKTNAPRSRHP